MQRPSRSWAALAALLIVGAIVAVIFAIQVNTAAQRPIGEGELFLIDGQQAVESLGAELSREDVRRLRNALEIEAVSLVDSDGIILASTSPSLEGTGPASPLMAGFADRGRFGAIAGPASVPISIDGVTEWDPGDVVYEVIQPLNNGTAALLTYDVSELLTRRSASGGVPELTFELLGVAGALALMAFSLLVARNRSARTYREFAADTDFLRRESEALTDHNIELNMARKRAELATALAEEKNRIRSEFVLMFNHELRTPLTSIVTGADLLATGGAITDPAWLEILDGVRAGGDRLSEMINQILVIARMENGALFFELQQVELSELLGRLAEVNPVFDIDLPSFDAPLQTDPMTAMHLLGSLADNALKHGASSVELSVSADEPFTPMFEVGPRPDRAVYLVLEDNGPGIDTDFLPKAFEKFEKDSRSSGTGLGLYIARMMVEALEGSRLVTTSSEGTSIALALPILSEARVFT